MVSKIRNVAKFLLGNVGPCVNELSDVSNWRFVDRLMLHKLYCFQRQVGKNVLIKTENENLCFVGE